MIQLFNEKEIGSLRSVSANYMNIEDSNDDESDENDDESSTQSNNEKNLVQSIFSRLVKNV
jgi:hypothetical protein